MIDKFIDGFDKFAQHDKLESYDNECKIALFSIFVKAMEERKRSVPQKQAQKRGNGGRKPASEAQKNLIRKFQGRGQLDENIDLEALNVAEASLLIDEGIANQQRARKEPRPKSDGIIQGAYSHESAGSESEGYFWE